MCNDFLISLDMQFRLNVLFFYVWLQKRKKRKMKEGKKRKVPTHYLPWNSLEPEAERLSTLEGGGTNNCWSPLCLNFHDQAIRSNQNTSSILRAQSPQCLPSLLQTAFKLLQDQVYSCLPWLVLWRGRSCYSANSWNQLKLTSVYCPSLSLEAASFL